MGREGGQRGGHCKIRHLNQDLIREGVSTEQLGPHHPWWDMRLPQSF